MPALADAYWSHITQDVIPQGAKNAAQAHQCARCPDTPATLHGAGLPGSVCRRSLTLTGHTLRMALSPLHLNILSQHVLNTGRQIKILGQ